MKFKPVRLLADFYQNKKPAWTRCNPSTREVQGSTKFKAILDYFAFKASLGYLRPNQQNLTLWPCWVAVGIGHASSRWEVLFSSPLPGCLLFPSLS